MTRIAVVDHGAGNLVSIVAALERVGASPHVLRDPEDLLRHEAVVVPGVGATASAMTGMRRSGLDEALQRWDRPLLGICVGMQLLFDRSEEDDSRGLGLLTGEVVRLRGRPLPHMGWNDVAHEGDPVFAGIPSGEPFYFVHSYAPVPTEDVAVGWSDHGGRFVAAVRSGPLVGVQFHPERSGPAGLRLLENFVAEVAGARRVA